MDSSNIYYGVFILDEEWIPFYQYYYWNKVKKTEFKVENLNLSKVVCSFIFGAHLIYLLQLFVCSNLFVFHQTKFKIDVASHFIFIKFTCPLLLVTILLYLPYYLYILPFMCAFSNLYHLTKNSHFPFV